MTGKLARGTVWTVAMRWGTRLLGLASTAVLARLLTPADFGLVAMAMALIMLADTLTNFGVETALVRDKNAGRAQFDTAWTVRQIQLLAVGGLIFLLAPLAAEFYGDGRITNIMRVIAISIALQGLENIGPVSFLKDLRFDRDFRFNITVKVVSVIITIGLAFYFRSYWALIFGSLSNRLARIVLSYTMSPYRPRWSLSAWRELWGFSQWVLLRGLADYLYNRLDVLFLGRASDAASLGQYTIAEEIAELPTTEISMPISRVLVPGFAQLVDEPGRLKAAYFNALGAVTTIVLPFSIGMALVADELVPLFLGPQWYGAIPILQIFTIFALFRTLSSLSGNLLVVLGQIRLVTIIFWVQALIVILGILPAFSLIGIFGVAILKAMSAAVGFFAVLYFLKRSMDIEWKDFAGVLWRPFLSVVVMAATLAVFDHFFASPHQTDMGTLVGLLTAKVFLGAFSYSFPLIAVWLWVGRPDGLEKKVVGLLKQKLLPFRERQ